MYRDVVRAICCRKNADPTIEEFTFEYEEKTDRLRVQAEMIRSILGPKFQIKPYPAQLKKPHLFLWGNANICVIARKQDQGGLQSMPDLEIQFVVEDLGFHKPLFFQ
jgi:hypothetical protein